MSNEITLSLALAIAKNGASVGGSQSSSIDMAGANFIGSVQTVPTAGVALDLGDVSAPPSYVLIQNLDAANFVEIDSANTFDKFPQKIRPGGVILLCPLSAVIHAKADTASVNVNVVAAEQ